MTPVSISQCASIIGELACSMACAFQVLIGIPKFLPPTLIIHMIMVLDFIAKIDFVVTGN